MTKRETYPQPPHGWTCFHCGETFSNYGLARDHFGATPEATAGCMLKVQLGEERGWLMEIRKLEAMIEQFCRDLNQAHDENIKIQGGDPRELDWPEWTPQANSIRWAEKRLKKKLAKTNVWTLYPDETE